MSGATLNMNGWTTVLANGDPNPLIATRPALDGGTARLYANGMVDAIDGRLYSLSPGFDSYADLNDWIENGEIEYTEWATECYRTVGAIWLENGTLAGWQLTLTERDPRIGDDGTNIVGTGLDANGDAVTEDERAYMDTQLGRYLSDEDEVIDHE